MVDVWQRRFSPGFTLIEIVMVLAISSALVLIAFTGQKQVRDRARFTDAMENIKSTLSKVQNEANTTVSTSPTRGTQVSPEVVFFGMRAELGGSNINVIPMQISGGAVSRRPAAEGYTVRIPWGVSAAAGSVIYFLRDQDTGRSRVFVAPAGFIETNPDNYVPQSAGVSNFTFSYGGSGLSGVLEIQRPNGEMRVRYN